MICEFPSKHFYGGKLKPDGLVKDRLTPPAMKAFWKQNGLKFPIAFCNIVGEETEASEEPEEPRSKRKKPDPHSKCNLGLKRQLKLYVTAEYSLLDYRLCSTGSNN